MAEKDTYITINFTVKMLSFIILSSIFTMVAYLWVAPISVVLWVVPAVIILSTLCCIDYKYYILPDIFTFGLMVYGLSINIGFSAVTSPYQSVLGLAIGGGLSWFIRTAFFWLRKVEGLGLGDVKLIAGLGAVFGIQVLPNVMIYACVIGLIFYSVQNYILKNPTTKIPFGSCLTLSSFAVSVYQYM